MSTLNSRTNDITLAVLSMTYGRFGYSAEGRAHQRIVSILNDDANRAEGEYGDDASLAAEKVRETLWNTFSGGGASAGATSNLFYALGRQDELGWVAGEASYPEPYGHRDFGWFFEDLTPEVKALIAQTV